MQCNCAGALICLSPTEKLKMSPKETTQLHGSVGIRRPFFGPADGDFVGGNERSVERLGRKRRSTEDISTSQGPKKL